ncbi:MAG: hypothetical protein HQK49_02760 [Oligoflexia bacterium]|nr:hypothetical protein [Oligoflexia bacterium]
MFNQNQNQNQNQKSITSMRGKREKIVATRAALLEKSEKEEIYQFAKTKDQVMGVSGVPLFVKINLDDFDRDFVSVIEELSFSKLNEGEINQINANRSSLQFLPKVIAIKNMNYGLHSSRARSVVASHKYKTQEQSFFKGDHFLYSYDGNLLVYSFTSVEWNLGLVYNNFVAESGFETINSVLSRTLGLALSHTGVIGFWGKIVNDGIVVSGRRDSKGKSVFISMDDGLIISGNEKIKIKELIKIYRHDPFCKHSARMTFEELYGYLLARCTYMHLHGPGPLMRKNLWLLAKGSVGVRTSEDL